LQNKQGELKQINNEKEKYYLKTDTNVSDPIEFETKNDELNNYASIDLTLNALEEAFNNDPKLYIKLKYYALKSIRFYHRKDVIEDQTAEDVVNNVIEKIINGIRKWNPDKLPNIVNLILMTIVSYVRNAYKKKKNIHIGIDLYNSAGELCEANISDLQRAYLQEDMTVEIFRDQLEDLISKAYSVLEHDVYATFVLEELLEIDHGTINNPVPLIAEKLKINETDVKNAIRRIKRNINKIFS